MSEVIKRIMQKVITDTLLLEFTWLGSKGKKSFNWLQLRSIVIGRFAKIKLHSFTI